MTWTVFDSTQALVDRVKQIMPRCLTPIERAEFGLGPEPPHWCVELSKWPYDTAEWAQWLSNVRAKRKVKLPDIPDQ
jgi:hypothetical protein